MPAHDSGGIRLHYESQGSGPGTVVMLHGLGSRGEDWLLQFPVLTPRWRVLAPDLRGHGRSGLSSGWPSVADLAGDVARLMEAESAAPAHLVGLSLGGAVALQLAIDRPELLRSLTAVNTFPHLRPGLGGLRHGAIRMALLGFGPMRWVGRWVANGLFPDEDQKLLRTSAAARIAGNPRRAYLQAAAAVARFDVSSRLGEIACPALIVAGERDATVPMKAKLELAHGISGARLEVIPGSGHATPLDAPEAFNALLLQFLKDVEAAA
jgi:3-oxoadipate enol-lactonase